MDTAQPPFLRLPIEIRLMIYQLLLLQPGKDLDAIHTTSFARILPTTPDYYQYERSKTSTATVVEPLQTLKIRTEDPLSYEQRRPEHRRTIFMIRSDRFRARCMNTTYHLLVHPGISILKQSCPF